MFYSIPKQITIICIIIWFSAPPESNNMTLNALSKHQFNNFQQLLKSWNHLLYQHAVFNKSVDTNWCISILF